MVAHAKPPAQDCAARRAVALMVMGSICGRNLERIELAVRERLPGATLVRLSELIVQVGKHLTIAIEREVLRDYVPGVDCEIAVRQDVVDRLIAESVTAAAAPSEGAQSC